MIGQDLFNIFLPDMNKIGSCGQFYFGDGEGDSSLEKKLTLVSKLYYEPCFYRDEAGAIGVAINNYPETGSKDRDFLLKATGVAIMYEETFFKGKSAGGGDASSEDLLQATKNKLVKSHATDLMEDLEHIFEVIRRNE